MRDLLAVGLIAALPLVAFAATPRTAVLDVRNMDCALCPITVRKALEKVPGVDSARIDFERKTATVRFDADKTSAAALIKATTDAGYPSTARE
jgi:periplasmic mercuric ion binding protein